jgi:hypothetical protein
MKKNIFTFLLASFLIAQGYSQSIADKSMTFFGVDFSKAKMIGGDGFKDPADVKLKFTAWNGLFKSEADKYDLYKPFKKDKIDFDFTNVESRNQAVKTEGLITNNDYSITPAQVESIVRSYDTKGKTGLGCVFVVESFDKSRVAGYIYVVLFDISSKKILVNKRMEEKPGGFGLKNYWAKAILETIEDSQSQFPKWVKGKDTDNLK